MTRTITVKLDRERNFKYGFRALRDIESKLGKGFTASMSPDNFSMNDIAVLFWAGLTHYDRNLTVEDVVDLIDDNMTVGEALGVITDAFQAAFGDIADDQPKNAQTAASPSVLTGRSGLPPSLEYARPSFGD